MGADAYRGSELAYRSLASLSAAREDDVVVVVVVVAGRRSRLQSASRPELDTAHMCVCVCVYMCESVYMVRLRGSHYTCARARRVGDEKRGGGGGFNNRVLYDTPAERISAKTFEDETGVLGIPAPAEA